MTVVKTLRFCRIHKTPSRCDHTPRVWEDPHVVCVLGTPLPPVAFLLDGPPHTAGFGETKQSTSLPGCAWLPWLLLLPQLLTVQKLLTARWPCWR